MNAVAFSPDGALLASAGDRRDGAVVEHRHRPAARRAARRPRRRGQGVAFSPDGALLVSAGTDQTVQLWDLGWWERPSSDWAEAGCKVVNRNLSQAEWEQFAGKLQYERTCPTLPAGKVHRTMPLRPVLLVAGRPRLPRRADEAPHRAGRIRYQSIPVRSLPSGLFHRRPRDGDRSRREGDAEPSTLHGRGAPRRRGHGSGSRGHSRVRSAVPRLPPSQQLPPTGPTSRPMPTLPPAIPQVCSTLLAIR